MRRGSREFCKTIHTYETSVAGKWYKVPVKMELDGGKPAVFFTDHFKPEMGNKSSPRFENMYECYDWIDATLGDRKDLEWQSKLFVQVSGYGSYDAEPSGYRRRLYEDQLTISVRAIEYAVDENGQAWQRTPNNPKSIEKFNEQLGHGEEKLYEWSDSITPYSRALIDDTPEVRERFAVLAVKFEELRGQFRKAMSQDYVHQMLDAVAGTKLLAAMEGE